MAAIARRICFLLALSAGGAMADQPDDVLRVINQVASALTENNPSDALIPIDKSLPNYNTLENEFIGLTSAYLITNEVEVLDEDDTADQTLLTLRWALTLASKETGESNSRSAEVHVRLRSQNGKWKIVELTPIDIFTP
ncbi:MAG: hypothetical protein JWP08_795 [Bryobacterales bacterium]|nr:hypothetical protein [Bryobacterales bacterium]